MKMIRLEELKFALLRKGIIGLIVQNDIQKIKEENRAYNFLRREFWTQTPNVEPCAFKSTNNSNIIWVCWLDGLRQAPELIQKCYATLTRHNADKFDIRFVDKENFLEYVEVPDEIVTKWKSRIINGAHFTDLLRVMLLNRYGGIWVDSTCYFVNEIPDYIAKQSLFLFSNERKRSKIRISNWFIVSAPHNPIISIMEGLLIEYWKKHNAAVHYFFFHLLWSMIYEKNKFTNNDYLFVSNMDSLALNHEINNDFCEEKWNYISRNTFVHKLNRKTVVENNKDNSFYSVLINEFEVKGERTYNCPNQEYEK